MWLVYTVGASASPSIAWTYTATPAGSFAYTLTSAGSYEFRLYCCDGFTRLVTSNVVVASAASSALITLSPLVSSLPQGSQTLISVAYTTTALPPASGTPWIGLFEVTQASTDRPFWRANVDKTQLSSTYTAYTDPRTSPGFTAGN